jgi:hypothetical protein
MPHRVRPSLLGSLLWIGFGILFLLRNFGIGPDFWSLVGRYWPIILILLGLGKIVDYFLHKDSVSIRFSEILGIFLLLVIGSAVTRTSESHFGRIIREMPIQIGGMSMRPGQWIGETHAFTDEMTYSLDHPLPILVENSYGSVSVSPGSDREVHVHLKKIVYGNGARARSIADEIRLEAKPERRGPATQSPKPEAEPGKKSDVEYFVVRTNREDLSGKDYTFNTDLEILVPKNSPVQVKNTFGEITVSEINGDLDLSTTHRGLEVRDCSGQFKISTRYADSRLTNLVGNLNLDARGKVYIDTIKGNVTVMNEYASLEIFNVDGELTASNTEGNIRIERVTKHVTIDSRGTEVSVDNLLAGLKVNASHKDVDISNIASNVAIESRFAGVSLKNVGGNVEIQSNSDRVDADDVRGSFKLKGRASEVQVTRIAGPLDIQTSLKDVVVNDFDNSCTITSEFAGIHVSSRKLGKSDVILKNRNGDVELFLPENASFLIDASARNGKVESDYPGLSTAGKEDVSSVKTKVKTGGPKISVETQYGSIRIHSTQSGEANQSDIEEDSNDNSALLSERLPAAMAEPVFCCFWREARIGAAL